MSLDKSQLIEFLEVLGEELSQEITLVAVGGTALTLLDLKSSTIDVDFTIPHEGYEEFTKAEKATPHGFKIDRWEGGNGFQYNVTRRLSNKQYSIKTKSRKYQTVCTSSSRHSNYKNREIKW